MAVSIAHEPVASVELAHPVEHSGGRLDCLVFSRRPNVGDLRAADGMGTTASAACIIARCCSIPAAVLDQVDVHDFVRASEVLAGFLPPPPPTGAPAP